MSLIFKTSVVLTYNSTSLILPTGANITTSIGDVYTFVSLGAGKWQCIDYQLNSGQALVGGGAGTGTVTNITAGSGLSGGTITSSGTFSVNIDGLTLDSSLSMANDELMVYSLANTANMKIKLNQIYTGGTVTQVTAGTGLDIGGVYGASATSTGTINLNINGLTGITSVNPSTDYLPVYNNTSGEVRKVLINNLGLNGTVSSIATSGGLSVNGALGGTLTTTGTIALDIIDLPTASTNVLANDYLIEYNSTAVANRKLALSTAFPQGFLGSSSAPTFDGMYLTGPLALTESTIASANTIAYSSLSSFNYITGGTAIMAISGPVSGATIFLSFQQACTLFHLFSGSSPGGLYLPGAANLTVSAGDVLGFIYDNVNTYWKCVSATTGLAAGSNATFGNLTVNNFLDLVQGAPIASASVITPTGSYFHVTGTTTILRANISVLGQVLVIVFDGALTLRHLGSGVSGAFYLPGGLDITTAAGDVGTFIGDVVSGQSVYRCTSYLTQASTSGTFSSLTVTGAASIGTHLTLTKFLKGSGTFASIGASGTNTTLNFASSSFGSNVMGVNSSASTTIANFDSTLPANTKMTLVFNDSNATLVNSTSLILPTGANIACASGDSAEFIAIGSGNWQCTNYMRANGQSLAGGGGGGISAVNGTTNEIISSTTSGVVTLSTPQAIATTSSPTFAGLTLNGAALSYGGNFTMSGAFAFTGTLTGTTSVTFPTSGTLVNTGVTTLSSLASIGTITTGTWNGTVIGSTYGGTGVNNGSSTITLGGNLTTSGAFATTLTSTGITNVTLPTSGTLVNTAVTTLSSLVSVGTITTGTWNATAVTVSFGGTGLTSTTAYAVLAGGTTSTGALQQVSGVGTSGQVLTSNGAGALPSWQAATGGTGAGIGLSQMLATLQFTV